VTNSQLLPTGQTTFPDPLSLKTRYGDFALSDYGEASTDQVAPQRPFQESTQHHRFN
jgi:hypothetical protein